MNGIWVAMGGFFGACARYGVNIWFSRFPSTLPRATLAVNLSGSFLLGLLTGENWGNAVYLLVGTGFLGTYTTFSTFKVENVQLARSKEWKVLMIYICSSYVLGILLAYVGDFLGTTIRKG